RHHQPEFRALREPHAYERLRDVVGAALTAAVPAESVFELDGAARDHDGGLGDVRAIGDDLGDGLIRLRLRAGDGAGRGQKDSELHWGCSGGCGRYSSTTTVMSSDCTAPSVKLPTAS